MLKDTGVPAAYKQTEVGVVPEEWGVNTFGEIFKFLSTGNNSRSDLSEYGEIKNIHYGDIHTKWKYFLDCSKDIIPSINKDKVKNLPLLEEGDLVMADASEDYDGLGVSVEIKNIRNEKVVAGLHTLLLRGDKTKVADGFKGYIQSIKVVRDSLNRIATGISVYGISKNNLKNILIPLPPLPEQQAIASALSDVDALITALEHLITKKRNIKQGAMQQLLTGKKRLPGFGGEWKAINISENSVLKARIGWQGLTTAEYLKNGEYYLVTGTDFIDGKIKWSGCHFVDKNRYVQDKNIQLRNDDVLITKDGTIGKVGYIDNLPGKATLNSGVFVIRPRDKSYFPLFFYYVLKSSIFDSFMNQLQAGSTISHLYQKDFVNFSFSAPSLDEQQAIAHILSDMDTEIEALEQKRYKYRALKQGMMQELLTGKTRLV